MFFSPVQVVLLNHFAEVSQSWPRILLESHT